LQHKARTVSQALLIDLDDTLYEELSYVESGFAAVAATLAARMGGDPVRYHAMMRAELETHGRSKVFDRVLKALGMPVDPLFVGVLVDTYRNHTPSVALYSGVPEALTRLAKNWRIAIVTDGLAEMQRRKVRALGLEGLVETIVYCWELGAPKPQLTGYLEAMRLLDVNRDACIVIGDNPMHDMEAARALGVPSIRVLTGKLALVPATLGQAPDLEIGNMAIVQEALAKLLPALGMIRT
jgi:putative hydrolase of the HAD superfamily